MMPPSPSKGVAFVAPPPDLIGPIRASLNRAIRTLPPGATGALVGLATEAGVNAAVVAKVSTTWTVQAWIGKSWAGPLEGGAAVMKTW